MPDQQPPINIRAYAAGAIIGAVLFTISLLIARTHELSGFQLQIFRAINDLPNGARTPALLVTEGLGAAYPIIAAIVIAAVYRRFRLAWRSTVVGGATVVVMEAAKLVAKEPRPYVLLHNNLHVRASELGLTSYPSGHMAVATALALVLWAILPRAWRWLTPAWILIMGFSRLYLGVHTPNDLVGGFAIGLVVVCAVWLLPTALAKPLRLDHSKPLLERGWRAVA